MAFKVFLRVRERHLFVSGLFDIRCKQHHSIKQYENGDVETTYKRDLIYFSQPKYLTVSMDTTRLKEINDTMQVNKIIFVVNFN